MSVIGLGVVIAPEVRWAGRLWVAVFPNAILGGAAALFLTLALGFVLQPAARKLGLVDRPDGRRQHATPTPAVGGLAILIAVLPLAFWLLPLTDQAKGVGLAALIILIAGALDDRYRLKWQMRMTAQVLATLVMINIGHVRIDNVGAVFGWPNHPLGPLGIPLTILVVVGIINAINMIDGLDGLAGTVSLMALSLIGCAAAYAGNARLAEALVIVSGGLLGFLALNLRSPWNQRARIFLGNAGSEVLGLIIAAAAIRLTQNPLHPVGVQAAPFLILPAVLDCLTLMIRRVRMGVSPFLGDRNHMHHLLLDAGLSVTGVVTLLAIITLLCGGLALASLRLHVAAPVYTAGFLVSWAAYYLLTRRRARSVESLAQMLGWATWLQKPSAPPRLSLISGDRTSEPRLASETIGGVRRSFATVETADDQRDNRIRAQS